LTGDQSPVVTAVRTFVTAPDGVNLVVVRVETDVDGLFGLGCGTFTFRAQAVAQVVDSYLAPRLVGRSVRDITDVFYSLYLAPYWRTGPIENNALSAIDLALWDLKGKLAGMPVWSLLGGKVRQYLDAYRTVPAPTKHEVVEIVGGRIDEGELSFRVLLEDPSDPTAVPYYGEPYMNAMESLLRVLRREFGDAPNFIVDVHGRLSPSECIRFANAIEEWKPHYLEDPLVLEDLGWLPRLRAQTRVPIAMGELFTDVNEYALPISRHEIDFVRCHITSIGGLTPAIRLSHLAELFGVKTAWHGPADLSPIGHAANAALGISAMNFGIHEHSQPGEATREVFPGSLVMSGGRIVPSDAPGWGIEFDEQQAANHEPVSPTERSFLEFRRRADGTIQHP
jgi:mannonate dehydratase